MKGIWQHAHLLDELPAERPSLGEGNTPLTDLPSLAAQLGLASLRLKREDQNPNGSHKDRGLLFQVAHHRAERPRTHVISSSGNAATSAAAACALTGDRLVAFVAHDTDPAKVGRIAARGGLVVRASKPVNFARYAARVFGLVNLRGTADPSASIGYRSLAGELRSEGADAVVTFSSSGVSVRGILDGFERGGSTPAVWSVQSGRCIALARALDENAVEDPESPAGRLGARNPPGAEAMAQRLAATGGGAVAVDSSTVARGQAWLQAEGVSTSHEGGAVLGGLAQLVGEGRLSGHVVAVMTGAQHAKGVGSEGVEAQSYLDVRGWMIDALGLDPL
jgi:threonine synthase